jgi:hypothetical protein
MSITKSAVLALILALAFNGCGKNTNNNTNRDIVVKNKVLSEDNTFSTSIYDSKIKQQINHKNDNSNGLHDDTNNKESLEHSCIGIRVGIIPNEILDDDSHLYQDIIDGLKDNISFSKVNYSRNNSMINRAVIYHPATSEYNQYIVNSNNYMGMPISTPSFDYHFDTNNTYNGAYYSNNYGTFSDSLVHYANSSYNQFITGHKDFNYTNSYYANKDFHYVVDNNKTKVNEYFYGTGTLTQAQKLKIAKDAENIRKNSKNHKTIFMNNFNKYFNMGYVNVLFGSSNTSYQDYENTEFSAVTIPIGYRENGEPVELRMISKKNSANILSCLEKKITSIVNN